jgi:hypothetical protein
MATKHFLGGRIILGTEFAGYLYRLYEPGTSTFKTTYKDANLTVGNENQTTITLDANGACQIWFDGNADSVFLTAAGVVVYSDDDVNLSDSTAETGTYNLVLNNSYEDDTDGDGIPDNWTRTLYTDGTFSVVTDTQNNGSSSIKFTSTGTGGGYIAPTNTFAVSPSVIYTVGFALKSSDAGVRNVVEMLWYKADGTASATSSTTVYDDSTTNPTSWTEKWYEATSPSDAYFAKIRLTGCHSSDATAGSTWYDAVYVSDSAIKRAVNTFIDANTYIVDNSDSTKKVQFQVSGVTTATTRTITIPDQNSTMVVQGDAATQAEQETGSSTTKYVTPGRQHLNASASKAWAQVTVSAGVPTLVSNYNCSGVVDNGTGDWSVTFTTSFSSGNYAAVVSAFNSSPGSVGISVEAKAVGSVRVQAANRSSGAASDALDGFDVICMGDQ